MSKIQTFVKKPRNIYFSIILMLTLVTGLFSISFSYYIDESSTNGLLTVKGVDNRLQSDDLTDGIVALAPHETKTITVNIMSNNSYDSKYALYYKSDNDVKVLSTLEMDEIIKSKEVQQYELIVSNFEENPASVFIGIVNGQVDAEVSVPGSLIEVEE
ncbi:MAG: hypothetical protein J1F35_04195 [Erysipelotrichales bacterium]|nr:hypothetical protein [Erysipelotrichales bacterium]